MNDDLISRQAAIDKFEPWLNVQGYSEGERNMLKAVLYDLKFLPSAQPEVLAHGEGELSAQPEPQWIPGNERISEGLIIVQFNDGDFDLLQFPTAYRRKDIVAWMPLPEPWKGEQPC